MGKPLMIHEDDDLKIEQLKARTNAKSKVEVVRQALLLLEKEVKRQERMKQWEVAVHAVGDSGLVVQKEFKNKKRFQEVE